MSRTSRIGTSSGGIWPLGSRHLSLAYLLIYFAPWLEKAPDRASIVAAVGGVGLFLPLYLHAVQRPWSSLPHVVAVSLLGFLLSPFDGAWSVFGIFASSLAGRLHPERKAVGTIAGLQIALAVFGLLSRSPWPIWTSGIFFGTLAGLGTLWLKRLEAKNKELEEAQSQIRALAEFAERERIAGDLHDLLGHSLTVVAVKADLAVRLSELDMVAAKGEMQEVAAVAREALGEVRKAVSGLRHASWPLEVIRVRNALQAAGVRMEILTGDISELAAEQEAALCLVLRETTTNIIRHANAASCRIMLQRHDDRSFSLDIRDDGTANNLVEGNGFRSMRERLSRIGGSMTTAGSESGLTLTATIPDAWGEGE